TRRLEEARRQAAMVHVTDGIAHNLNNMLGVATGYLGLIMHRLDDRESVERNGRKLQESLKRMAETVHELTRIGQFDSVYTHPQPLGEIIEQAIRQFRKAIGTEAKVDIHNDLEDAFELETNREIFASTLEKLLLNAWQSYERLKPVPDERGIQLN